MAKKLKLTKKEKLIKCFQEKETNVDNYKLAIEYLKTGFIPNEIRGCLSDYDVLNLVVTQLPVAFKEYGVDV